MLEIRKVLSGGELQCAAGINLVGASRRVANAERQRETMATEGRAVRQQGSTTEMICQAIRGSNLAWKPGQ